MSVMSRIVLTAVCVLTCSGASAAAGSPPDCDALTGRYADPLDMRWGRIDGDRAYDGMLVGAWSFFRLDPKTRDPRRGGLDRAFEIAIDADGALSVHYFDRGEPVDHRTFAPDAWHCAEGRASVRLISRRGVIEDKLPNHGTTEVRLEISRDSRHGGSLRLRETTSRQVWLFHLVPRASTDTREMNYRPVP